MSMSKPNKPAEKEASPSSSTTSTTTTAPKTDIKGLKEALKKKGVEYSQFATAEENWRKRALKGDYQPLKTQYAWRYDEPIKEEETKETTEEK